ncbi:PHP domain-containing protein [Paenibacillus glycinis]|uniref:PHP domain-containing protein n=1 Tax=Paenibacillus glycinis TaxID=2697035 RepID=A0ABW9XM32_9BACL|nr:PHP domain-containing protein [Paenibacillus glycinis]NBD23664.1 PHP domain-containing protein [Paenibacillus glycinis]
MNSGERRPEAGGKIDLHCHTSASDNTFSAEDVVGQAAAAGIATLAITDHDTTAGLPDAMRTGKRLGVEIVPGIEISAYDFGRKRRAHILGLFVEPEHPALARLCGPIVERRTRLSEQMTARLIEAGYGIDWDLVRSHAGDGGAVFKQHVMHALVDRGYANELFGALYRELFSRGEGDKPGIAYLPMQYVDARDAIRAVLDAGGVPVLAHPGQLGNYEAIPDWVDCGLQGIEVHHPSHDEADCILAAEAAARHGLIATGGSDYHGGYGSARWPLGSIDAGTACLEALRERAGQNAVTR